MPNGRPISRGRDNEEGAAFVSRMSLYTAFTATHPTVRVPSGLGSYKTEMPNIDANEDRKSGVLYMSAFVPKADMCSAQAQVRYGPIADVDRLRRFE